MSQAVQTQHHCSALAKEVRTDDSGSFVCYRGGGTVHNVLLLKPCTKANLTILQKHKFLSQCPIVTLLKYFKLIVVSGQHLTLDEMWPQKQKQTDVNSVTLSERAGAYISNLPLAIVTNFAK